MGRGQRRESCHRGARAARRGTLRAPPRALGLGTPPPPRTCWARQGEGTCSENWRGCPRARPSPSSVESVSRAPLRPILVSAGEPGAHSWGRPKGLGRAEAFLAAITCGCPRRLPLAGRSLSYMLCHPSIHIFLCSSLHRSSPRTGVSPFVSLCETRWSWRRLVGMASLAVSAKQNKKTERKETKKQTKRRGWFSFTPTQKSLGAPSMHCARAP